MITTTSRTVAGAMFSLVLLVAAGCGDGDSNSNDTPANDDAPAACLVDDPTCYETGAENSGG